MTIFSPLATSGILVTKLYISELGKLQALCVLVAHTMAWCFNIYQDCLHIVIIKKQCIEYCFFAFWFKTDAQLYHVHKAHTDQLQG